MATAKKQTNPEKPVKKTKAATFDEVVASFKADEAKEKGVKITAITPKTPERTGQTKPTHAAKKPAKAAKTVTPVFEGTVKKKVKTPKPTIKNSTLIGKMVDSITGTFS